jgi:hypothetical protein
MKTGTITNGNDMIAAFLKQLYPGPLSKTVCAIADVGDRGQDFPPENENVTIKQNMISAIIVNITPRVTYPCSMNLGFHRTITSSIKNMESKHVP